MKELIANFSTQLREAMDIGMAAKLKEYNERIDNILIAGMGGSGIGATIVKEILEHRLEIPIEVVKSYETPSWVGPHTLVIVSSYSGNTEETIAVMKESMKRNAEVAAITSGGYMDEIAYENGLNHIVIPGGNPPRSMLAYSFTSLFYLLKHYGVVNLDFETELRVAESLLDKEEANIRNAARKLAKFLHGKLPVIYGVPGKAGVAERFRQQLNENAKMLCWHHIIPEMNHNELVGWAGAPDNLAVVFLRSKHENPRISRRIEINKEIIGRYTKNIQEVWSVGDYLLERILYLIHLTDWASYFLSEMNKVDVMEVKVIEFLKEELAKG